MEEFREGAALVAEEETYVQFNDYKRLEDAALLVCAALANYGGPDPRTKLRDDIIDAGHAITNAFGVEEDERYDFYSSLMKTASPS